MRRRHLETLCLLGPAVALLGLLFVVPLARLFSLAFTDDAGALSTFALLAESEVYRRGLVNNFVVGGGVTVITVVLPWPVAYFLRRLKGIGFPVVLFCVVFLFLFLGNGRGAWWGKGWESVLVLVG